VPSTNFNLQRYKAEPEKSIFEIQLEMLLDEVGLYKFNSVYPWCSAAGCI
jgi:hypothetical protein